MAASRSENDSATKKNLSKNVLQMKFMQRGIEQQNVKAYEGLKQSQIKQSHWVMGGVENQVKQLPYEFDTSQIYCEELLPIGRMSFLGYNPQVEKIHQMILREARKKSKSNEDEDELSDEEMAHRYENLIGTVAKKFEKKSKRKTARKNVSSNSESDEDLKQLRKRAKRGFLKPKVD
ncbi:M-phase phosphoprotein 6-like isoform X2 [Hydractinia symbiolongicarpus]|uniref:M-phase phosphoprotein 6-like isoform X2 n=1 Tax=Hydractinia symbiolongicarpus TaxID=13093 RepID=UPI00254ABE38|nr:M-phase phosphoprotein 6-like isoform X2 [Hydractinia symbiolongicarpus]